MRRALRAAGFGLLLLGVAVNRYTLGLLTGASIDSLLFNAVLVACETACIVVGLLLVRNPARETLISIALMAASFFVCFLILEAGVRLRYFGTAGFSPAMMNSVDWLYDLDLLQPSQFKDLRYELRPNTDSLYTLVPLQTNEHGMRDKPLEHEKPEDTFRIAVLGDSYSIPLGVPIEDAWFRKLEKKLQEENFGDGKVIETLNFAVSGYQLQEYEASLRHKALSFDPDLLIIGFCAETDDWRMVVPLENMLSHKSKVPSFYHSWFIKLVLMLNHTPMGHRMLWPTDEDMNYVGQKFAEIAALCKQEEIPVVLAYLGNIPRHSTPVRRISEKHDFQFIDCSSRFDGTRLTDYSVYYPFDYHPNAAANALFAEDIAAALLENDAETDSQ